MTLKWPISYGWPAMGSTPPPTTLRPALAKNARARSTFEGFSPSHRREYVEWIEDAKRPQIRARRLTTAVDWMAEGKSRHWKYR